MLASDWHGQRGIGGADGTQADGNDGRGRLDDRDDVGRLSRIEATVFDDGPTRSRVVRIIGSVQAQLQLCDSPDHVWMDERASESWIGDSHRRNRFSRNR